MGMSGKNDALVGLRRLSRAKAKELPGSLFCGLGNLTEIAASQDREPFRDKSRVGRFTAASAMRRRRQKGTIRFHHERTVRRAHRSLMHGLRVLKCHDAREGNQMPEVE